MLTLRVLFSSKSCGFSKSGASTKSNFPSVSIVNNFASLPPIELKVNPGFFGIVVTSVKPSSILNVEEEDSAWKLNYVYYLKHLNSFLEKKKNEEFDKAAEDLRLSIRHLGTIVGRVDVEEILGSIFDNFCIGK